MTSLNALNNLLQSVESQDGSSHELALQRYVLQHHVLTESLPSSGDLAFQIQALTIQRERDAKRIVKARADIARQLASAKSRVSRYRAALDALPPQIEALDDAIDSLTASLESSGEQSLPSRLKKHVTALGDFQSAQDYFAVLSYAQSLWDQVQTQEKLEPGSFGSLDSLADAAHLGQHVRALLVSMGAPVEQIRLLKYLDSRLRDIYDDLKRIRTAMLRSALGKSGWPPLSPEQAEAQDKPLSSLPTIFSDQMIKIAWKSLMNLQIVGWLLRLDPQPSCISEPSLLEAANSLASQRVPGSQEYVPLWTTSVLLEPYLLRFKFHFDSSRLTNRLDKPEWYLNHILSLVKQLHPLFSTASPQGPAVKLNVSACHRYGKSLFRSLHADLLHVLLKPLQAKVASSFPLLIAQEDSQLLAHTVSSLLTFDKSLEDMLIAEDMDVSPIKIAENVLRSDEWFSAWVRVERSSSLDTLDAILEDGNAWSISTEGNEVFEDEDGPSAGTWAVGTASSSDEVKTTRSSRHLVKLLENLTNTYTAFPFLLRRLQFLTEIQLPLLRAYHQRLTRSLDAFESLSSAFARAIPGSMTDATSGRSLGDQDMVRGLRGLSRLLKAYLSASHIILQLRQWQEEGFFLQMSHDLLASEDGAALLRQQREEAEDRELDAESLASLIRKSLRGSYASTNDGTRNKADSQTASDSVWDEPLKGFSDLADRARGGICRLVVSEVNEGLKEYALQTWCDCRSPFPDGQDPMGEGVLAESVELPAPSLLPALTSLHLHLSHLLPILDSPTATRIYRAIAQDIADSVVQRVVLAGGSKRFTQAGGERFWMDWERGWRGVLTSLQQQEQQSKVERNSLDARTITKMGLRPEYPWRYLRDTATLLALPSQSGGSGLSGGWTLARATLLLWSFDDTGSQGEEHWSKMRRELGLSSRELGQAGEQGRQRAREILRRRIDCIR